MSKIALSLSLLVCISHAVELTSAKADNELGITKTQPSSGYYVAYEDVYLIPYSLVIPGTESSIEMVPVPAGRFKLSLPARKWKTTVGRGGRFAVLDCQN